MANVRIDSEKIDKLAQLAVYTGLGLRPGQDLILTAPVEALPLVKRIAVHAYKAGAGLVTPLFSDGELTLARYKYANNASFDKAPDWLYNGIGKAFDNNAARMAIVGDDPMLLANQDSDKIGRANKANSIAYKPARERITRFNINWNIIAWPGAAWAKRMFPELSGTEAQSKLADAIFDASRVNTTDPVEEWKKHNEVLRKKCKWLNELDFASLHFNGPGTDLIVGLADGHEWMGGASIAQNGITCNPNIPSEEVFTTPHALNVNGSVCSTKPLSHQGALIDEIQVRFENGKITNAKASKGEEVLLKILDSDEGARRLGEVALVPNSSPISQSGLLFYNTLFDENAACHIALGQCYSKCFKGEENLSEKEILKRGGNSSMIHIDWMIGSRHIDIDGINSDGSRVAVFRKGEWA
ncbi:MAG: aminopeptidase [Paracoccaceae bacterium]|nr:aminopeptidase [Paracoccaceae bacterium]MDG1939583.1 aminopeptidase [Paracoccaceae bacterium]